MSSSEITIYDFENDDAIISAKQQFRLLFLYPPAALLQIQTRKILITTTKLDR